jgi:hypothetical protein
MARTPWALFWRARLRVVRRENQQVRSARTGRLTRPRPRRGCGWYPLVHPQRIPRRLSPDHRIGTQGGCQQLAPRRQSTDRGLWSWAGRRHHQRRGNASEVWRWIDAHGGKYGLYRPMPDDDPAHVQPKGSWHKLAASLRESRARMAAQARATGEASAQ